jgi:sugar lactone lactonase YvrE
MSINRKLGDLANVLDDGTEGQVLSFNASGKIAASTISTEGTLGTLTQSFDSDQTSSISLSSAANTVPFVSVFKEVPQLGVSSKGQWDVNSNGTNYDFYDEKPISYTSSTLTPSATGDGTFTNSAPVTSGYDFTNFAYDNVTAATGISGNNEAIRFNNNGTKMYILSDGGPDGIYQFSLSTAYDITTASYDSVSFSVTQDSSPRDFHFNSDGSKMFILGSTNRSIYQFSLSTAYDLSTTSYDSVSLSVAFSTSMLHFHFNGDGTKIYVGSGATWTIYERQLPGAYDISSESAVSTFGYNADLPSGSTEAYAYSGIFNDNGKKMYLLIGRMPDTSEAVIEYDLSTAYDLSTISRTSIQTLNPSNAGNDPRGMTWNSDGTKLIILTEPDDMFRFTSSTSSAFNSSDVGKKVVGNSGSAIITSTAGAYTSVTAFADTSAISSWQLFGAQGKADGSGIELTGLRGGYDFPNLSYTGRSFNLTGAVATLTSPEGMAMKPDGTIMWVLDKASDKIVEFSLSTPYQINTASSTGNNLDIVSYESAATGIYVNSEGTRLIIIGSNQDEWNEFHSSNAWNLTSFTHDHVLSIATHTSGVTAPQDLVFNEDGSRMFIISPNTDNIFGYTLSTAFDISTISSAGSLSIASIEGGGGALNINADGTELYISGTTFDNLQMLKLDTAYDLSSYNASASLAYSWTSDGSNIGTTPVEGITISKNGTKLYLTTNTGIIHEYYFGDAAAVPYSQYMPALTNSSTGQINSSTWVDINSMTADETKNDGDIFYAVSTDNRTSWGVAKGSDGVRKIAKNNSGTWQYNNNAGTGGPVSSVADAVYESQFSIATANNKLRDILFNSDGTKMYLLWFSPDVRQYSLSVAYDISTAVSDSVSLTTNSEETLQTGMKWNNDGTKLYIIGYSNDKVHEYVLTTAYDLSTASYNNVFFSVSSQMATPFGLTFKPDGTKMYATDNAGNIYQYTLSTAWDLSSAAYDNISFSVSHLAEGLIFNSLGTKLHYVNSNTLRRWNLSTAWDISTLTFESSLDFDLDIPSNGVASGLAFNNDESRIYITWRNADGVATYNLSVLGYGASETWVNGTNNNEHATLQQALTSQAFNRMNKAQLDAVADGYHFSQDSADTLDLMIVPYATSGTSPISDGVTINYDAASKYKQAIHGTEYDVEFTTTNSVDLTSKISANLKARVL